ncbi:MAG: DNA translocase FtsK 4TM domain-containing protein [Nitrospirae bacterium]|nr:DNA translocase FtsK 4TM domain-containing protein [Nitrospirota bacterium]
MTQAAPVPSRSHEIRAVLLFLFAVLSALALLTYSAADPSLNSASSRGGILNRIGVAGAFGADFFFQVLGGGAYLLPIAFLVAALRSLRPQADEHARRWPGILGVVLLFVSVSALSAHFYPDRFPLGEPIPPGGVVGTLSRGALVSLFSDVGTVVILFSFLLIALIVTTRFTLAGLLQITASSLRQTAAAVSGTVVLHRERALRRREAATHAAPETKPRIAGGRETAPGSDGADELEPPPGAAGAAKPKIRRPKTDAGTLELDLGPAGRRRPDSGGVYQLPPLSLLADPPPPLTGQTKEELFANASLLEAKLRDFAVEGRVTQVYPGPIVTMYEYEPAPGVKINRVVTLADDLALALKAPAVRVGGQIPGKAAIGIEVPNPGREPVHLKAILTSPAFREPASPLTIALGKDIFGTPVAADLARMPHLLVAGATGAGKSMGLNVMILSLLFNTHPRDVKFLLIDPKRLELSVYEDIPHLIEPVVTESKKAGEALGSLVAEMEHRYHLLAAAGARNIESYNAMIDGGQGDKNRGAKSGGDSPPAERIPYVVVVIDELADLMMVSARRVEESIARLAQMARAAGIHLILATQRPSVDVLTGVIKANFPARIAFQTASKIDSRTILDSMGAEQLLGKGDMLFMPPGTNRLQRIHGAFVTEAEIARVVEHTKAQAVPLYGTLERIMAARAEAEALAAQDAAAEERDDLYEQARAIVASSRNASITHLQRRMRVGYNRAARMIEDMERDGIVSAPRGPNRDRDVLVPPDER